MNTETENVNIEGLDRAEVLAALFNGSKAQGMGFFQPHAQAMTKEEAEKILQTYHRFDYLRGRVMKISLDPGAKDFNPRLYDRDIGQGAAQRLINTLRSKV